MASILDTHFDDESDEEEFNPEPEVGSDNEEDANGTERRAETSSKARRKGGDDEDDEVRQNRDDEDEGDGEEDEGEGDNDDNEGEDDEEDEDDEDAVAGRPHKRRKRDPRMAFIDVEAEVDDEDEEEELDDDDAPDETHPDDLLDMPAGAENDDRRHRELDRQRELAASMDAEKQAQALKERYGRNRAAASDLSVLPQRLLLPSVDDPSIWGVRCKPGKEREVILAIGKKIQDRAASREPLTIISAFERGNHTMAGYIYVEARRQEEVLSACDGINFCFARSKVQLIPINEMPDLLRVSETKQLKPGAWVRIKRGVYSGDIAEVLDVETNGLEVTLKIIPRLSYGLNEDINSQSPEKRKRPGGFNAPVGPRPPQRLFSEVEAKKKHGKFLVPSGGLKKAFTYLSETYEDGFLIKNFKLQALETEVQPKLEEIQLFTTNTEDGGESLDLAALYSTIKAGAASSFLPGDSVEIYQGEQQGVRGKAVSVHKDIVQLRVTEGELKGQLVEAPFKVLRKMFKDGDHVKVVGGSKYRDEVGMVVKVVEDRITLLTDANNQEITVFSRDLREAADSGGAVGFTKYDLFDLVQLDAATVACVIKVDRESLRVLTQNGDTKTLLPSQISGKIEKRRHAAAIDRDGSEIRNEDTVKEYAGNQRQGRVLHIHSNYLFVQNRQIAENAGIFVVRSSNVMTVAAKGGRTQNSGLDVTKMNPNVQRNGGSNGAQAQAMAPPKTMGRDRMIGKSVQIRKGPYKGLIGIVKDTTEKEARVELHSKNKVIAIPKDSVAVTDPITGQIIDSSKFSRGPGGAGRGLGGGTPFGSTRTPGQSAWDGGRTPSWQQSGSRTPAAAFNSGGRTPGWQQNIAIGNRTPAWNRNDGSRTVNPYADGSRTSYGGATAYGGSTWNPNAQTPHHSLNDGSKTPAWSRPSDLGGRTPAYSGADHAPTPGAWNATKRTPGPSGGYDAPTPGFSAPTPGDMGGPTPGPSYGGGYGGYGQTPAAAPTPGAYPETPGVYGAPTPAAYGDDDGPRYD